MVVKLDAQLQGLIPNAVSQLKVGATVLLRPATADSVLCALSDGRIVGSLLAEQVQHLPITVTGGVVRSVRKTDGYVSEVVVRFTASPTHESTLPGEQQAPVKENLEQGSSRLGRARLERLVASDELRPLLRDERLQKVIQSIDGATNREKALAAALQQPEFGQFCDQAALSFPSLLFIWQGKANAMLANIVDALQGPATDAVDDASTELDPEASQAPAPPAEPGPAQSSPPPASAAPAATSNQPDAAHTVQAGVKKAEQAPEQAFSWWGVASALADSVRKNTADIAASVKETDWRAELEAFRQGVAEDTQVVQRHTTAAVSEGRARLEKMPQQAQHARLPKMTPEQLQQLNQVGSRLGKLGASVMTTTKGLFEQVQESIQQELDSVEDYLNKSAEKPATSRSASRSSSARTGAGPKYSRLDAEVSSMQRNSATYCDEPADAADFAAWLQGFDLGSKKGDIEAIIQSNAFMAELQSRIVPLIVQYDAFWTRYFYQLHKLQAKHAQRQEVAQRAQRAAAEEVAWDDDAPSPELKGRGPIARVGSASSPPPPQAAPSDVAASVVAAPPASAAAAAAAEAAVHSGGSSPVSARVQNRSGLDDEGPETSTASDDSAQGPWTVVTSPSHARKRSDEVSSPTPPQPPAFGSAAQGLQEGSPKAPQEGTGNPGSPVGPPAGPSAQPGPGGASKSDTPRTPAPGKQKADEEDLADLDISDDDGAVAAAGGADSEVDEDWGSWE